MASRLTGLDGVTGGDGDRRWRLLVSGKLHGALNMAIDEAVLRAHADGKAPPTIRFYGWCPPALSVGALQRASLDVDVSACKAAGVDVVRRPTGGRAVLHDDELTYSVVVSESHPLLPKGVREAYAFIARGLVDGLARLGVQARIAESGGPGRQAYREGPTVGVGADGRCVDRKDFTAACFESPSWYEIVACDGRKLVGSAQMRASGVLLQHGSIPLSLDADRLFSLLKPHDPGSREESVRRLERRATSMVEVLGRRPATDEVVCALTEGIRSQLGIILTRGTLSAEEEALATELANEKYSRDEWNFRR